ncbi:MAG: FlgD immunoglobulin-like domain containing protein [Candidatus Eisenbacteria bacterium]
MSHLVQCLAVRFAGLVRDPRLHTGLLLSVSVVCLLPAIGIAAPLSVDTERAPDQSSPGSASPEGAYAVGSTVLGRAPGDTLSFGNVDGDGFAVLGDVWTFDHGGPDPLEGFTTTDLTTQPTTWGRHLTAAAWDADPRNDVAAPVLRGNGSAYIGAFGTPAYDLCWTDGLGYGNEWCQDLTSPVLIRGADADVEFQWVHFNDTEEHFDYVTAYFERMSDGELFEIAQYTGEIGLAGTHPIDPPVGAEDTITLSADDFIGATDFRIVFRMTSDGSWSDEDGLFSTSYGPMALDDVTVTEVGGPVLGQYGFESDLEGWTASGCPGVGTFVGIAAVSNYVIEDACDCGLSGNVLEFHDDNETHPDGQHVMVVSPPVDIEADVRPFLTDPGALSIFADWDQYADLPRLDGVFIRAGWQYYPFLCPISEESGWSGRVGESTFSFVTNPDCALWRDTATLADVPVPQDAEQVRFVYEVYSSCADFGIAPGECTFQSNATPLIDNIQIRFTRTPNAPPISFNASALNYQDGFAQNTLINDPREPGRADVSLNVIHAFTDTPPFVLGDSVVISGPAVTSTENQWESRLWFRVSRVGPGADTRYTSWRDRVADGNAIDPDLAGAGNAVEFTFAYMDSCQQGTNAFRNKFCTYFREDDDDFDPAYPEISDQNEIIADDVLFPGTQVEYFFSANYLVEPGQRYLLPDTTGGYFDEFEILPSWRDEGGTWKYPCFLQIGEASNRRRHVLIDEAIALAGIEADRFDMRYACGCSEAPLSRVGGSSNNGMTLAQLMGYRGLLIHTGFNSEFFPIDYSLFSDYLTAGICATDSRGLVWSGAASEWGGYFGVGFANAQLGADVLSANYREFTGDENFCVRLEAPSGGGEAYGTTHSGGDYTVSAFGNGCPDPNGLDVLTPVGTGVGNRVYVNETNGLETGYAQVVNESVSPYNFRTVYTGAPWNHLAGQNESGDCQIDEASRIGAIRNEIQAAVEWIYGVSDIPSLCEDPCADGVSAIEPGSTISALATRLDAGTPNPFRPQTTLRYSLGAGGPVDLAIFDVAGRRIRTLASGESAAGSHDVVWDGTDESGHRVASGTYWARLEAAGRRSASRLVLLK